MPAALEMIRAEHRTMTRLLDLLERQIDLFEITGEPDYELIGEILDYFRSYPDLYHHPKEDLIFRRLEQRAPEAAKAFGNLEAEHEKVTQRLSTFTRAVVNVLMEAEISRDALVHVARDFIDGERRHMAAEEKFFFPAAERSLSDEDWADIDRRVSKFKDPILEQTGPDRYTLLREELARWRGQDSAA